SSSAPTALPSFPTRRSSDLHVFLLQKLLSHVVDQNAVKIISSQHGITVGGLDFKYSITQFEDGNIKSSPSQVKYRDGLIFVAFRSEEHTSELQSRENLVCRL